MEDVPKNSKIAGHDTGPPHTNPGAERQGDGLLPQQVRVGDCQNPQARMLMVQAEQYFRADTRRLPRGDGQNRCIPGHVMPLGVIRV